MKRILPSLALLISFAALSEAQVVLPSRPSGVVTSNHDVVTRNGSNNYLLYAPEPVYPNGAARQGVTVRGVFMADLSLLYGTVDEVRVLTSTGSRVLDDAAKAAISQWVFRRYTVYKAAIPVEFDASGHVHVGADPGEGPTISAILANMNLVQKRKH
jgi:TonB family protein